MQKNKNFMFWVLIIASILLCCKCFQTAVGGHNTPNVIGGEIFTLVLPLWLIDRKLTTTERTNHRLKQQLKKQQQTLNEQAELIDHLLSEKEPTPLQHIADVPNVVENPTE